MKRLIARGKALAREMQRRRVRDIAGALRQQLRGVDVSEDSDAVSVRGRNLLRRWLADPSFRFVGSLLR